MSIDIYHLSDEPLMILAVFGRDGILKQIGRNRYKCAEDETKQN